MRVDPEAAIMHKCRELIMQLNVNLNHFPRHEKHGLCLQIRNCVYDVLSGLVECQKRYHNKTSLTKLDVRHEQLRTLVNLAFGDGVFRLSPQQIDAQRCRSAASLYRRSVMLNELGAMIGGWIRSLRVIPQAE